VRIRGYGIIIALIIWLDHPRRNLLPVLGWIKTAFWYQDKPFPCWLFILGKRMLTLYRDRITTEEGMPLTPGSTFNFHCRPELACFNRCCRETTVLLSPYDILRLRSRVRLSSGEFLRRYTRRELEASSCLPLVLLKPSRSGGCPFLGEEGCRVYSDRPAVCRLFPVAQGSELTPAGIVDHYFLRHLNYCEGFKASQTWDLTSWQAGQGFREFDRPRRYWLRVLLKQGQPGRPVPDDRILSQVYLIAYDLDAFRAFLFESALLRVHGLDPLSAAPLKTDDLALLRFSAAYLEHLLFPEEALSLPAALRAALDEEAGKTPEYQGP